MDGELQARLGAERDGELRRARWWLFAVGAFYFVIQLIGASRPAYSQAKHVIIGIGVVMLLVFGGLWWFALKKPRLCLSAGLVVLWGAHIGNAVHSGSFYPGIIPKLIFTVGLLCGLASANRAEDLRTQLANVFE